MHSTHCIHVHASVAQLVYRALCLEYRVSSHLSCFVLGKVTALGLLCCFALFVCLTLLASFFLPSHLSFKNMYKSNVQGTYTYTYVVYL